MKKTITKSDGSVEVFEGTPEELAQLEEALREGKKPLKERKKEILRGMSTDPEDFKEFVKKFVEELLKDPNLFGTHHHYHYQYQYSYPTWQTIPWWSDPQRYKYTFATPPVQTGKITCGDQFPTMTPFNYPVGGLKASDFQWDNVSVSLSNVGGLSNVFSSEIKD